MRLLVIFGGGIPCTLYNAGKLHKISMQCLFIIVEVVTVICTLLIYSDQQYLKSLAMGKCIILRTVVSIIANKYGN